MNRLIQNDMWPIEIEYDNQTFIKSGKIWLDEMLYLGYSYDIYVDNQGIVTVIDGDENLS